MMMGPKINAAITGTGAALPQKRLTNLELEKMVDTNDEWIVSRTGIRERRILEEGLGNIDLTYQAAEEALREANLTPEELDLILVATITPDYITPSTSCLLQGKLGALGIPAMDIAAGCTGFIYALSVAQQFIQNGTYKNVLVVGSDILTRLTDMQDRGTCILFGDGAGAVVLQPAAGGEGIMAQKLGADGRGAELLMVPAGGSAQPASVESVQQRLHYVRMNGNEVFKFAVRAVEDTLAALLQQGEVEPGELDYLFLHQANLRIIELARKRLKMPPERVPVHIDRYGNMSSAAIPVSLHEEAAAGRLKKGDLLAMVAFGAGLTWGGILMRW